MADYKEMCEGLQALISGVPHVTANLANASAFIYESLEDINWAGFYILENGLLVLGPFQGRPACIEIKPGKGVCGTAIQTGRTQLVYNVHEFPGHIACDPRSRSEIVVPLYKNGELFGVLDIDSATVGRFDEHDREGVESLARIIELSL